MKMVLMVAGVLSLASILSACMITASDMPSPETVFRDVDNDGYIDLVEEGGEVFWNQGNDEFFNNHMVLRNLHPPQQGFWIQTDEGYWVQNHSFDPSNCTAQEILPPVLALNTFKIEPDRCIMYDVLTQNVTIYRDDGTGTYVPKKTMNPMGDFNLLLQITTDEKFIGWSSIR